MFLASSQHMGATPELCKRTRFRKSTCQICVDVCPDAAITLAPGPTINDNCSNCGLCQTACPTEVFQRDVNLDQLLLAQVASLLRKDPVPGSKQRLSIHCSEACCQDEGAFEVHCLGNLTENSFLGAALAGLDEMHLVIGDCSKCHLESGVISLVNSIASSRAMMDAVEIESFALSIAEDQIDNSSDAPMGRRELFSRVYYGAAGTTRTDLQQQFRQDGSGVGDRERLSNRN